jgi:hypothetical protein
MPDSPIQPDRELPSPPRRLDGEAKLQQALDALAQEHERLQTKTKAADLEILREALRHIRSFTSDVIACASISDAVAANHDKTHLILEASKRLGLAVDFVRVQGRTLASAEACEQFLCQLELEDDAPSKT